MFMFLYNAQCLQIVKPASTDDDVKAPQVKILTSEMLKVLKNKLCVQIVSRSERLSEYYSLLR